MTERNWNLPCCRARLRSARRRHGGSLRSVPGASNLARKNKRDQKIRVTTLDAYTSATSLILKHVRNWSYDTLEREVRANLVYRAFTRIGDEKVPDAKTLARLGQVIGPEVIGELHERLIELARERGVVQGRKMRVDTTVGVATLCYTSLSL